MESYQSLYLKVYYPLGFMFSVINNQGGFYRTKVYIHEAKMSGGNVQVPYVNSSEFQTTLKDKNIFLRLMLFGRIRDKNCT